MAGKGTLVLVVGASGAGKDTLIRIARRRLPVGSGIRVVEREITRPRAWGDSHTAVTRADFTRRSAAGGYLLEWRAHGVCYGLPREAEGMLEAGDSVLSITSRAMLDPARQLGHKVAFVHIEAPLAVIRQRLAARGGRLPSEIPGRIARAGAFAVAGPDVHAIDNGGPLQESSAAFVSLLLRLATSVDDQLAPGAGEAEPRG